jgi:hypothetical protein
VTEDVQGRVIVAVWSSALTEAFAIDGKYIRGPSEDRGIEAKLQGLGHGPHCFVAEFESLNGLVVAASG